jgi:hypothetical protein
MDIDMFNVELLAYAQKNDYIKIKYIDINALFRDTRVLLEDHFDSPTKEGNTYITNKILSMWPFVNINTDLAPAIEMLIEETIASRTERNSLALSKTDNIFTTVIKTIREDPNSMDEMMGLAGVLGNSINDPNGLQNLLVNIAGSNVFASLLNNQEVMHTIRDGVRQGRPRESIEDSQK